jgi:Helicase conserved C-terminal domain
VSDVLGLAQSLRKLSDQQLVDLCRRCLVQPAHLKDFFDLAEQILSPRSVSAWLASQNGSSLKALTAANTDSLSHDPLFDVLSKRLAGDPKSLGEEFGRISKWLSQGSLHSVTEPGFRQEAGDAPAGLDDYAAKDAGIRGFLAIQAMTEFVYELEHKFLSEVGKAGLALPDVKRFALLLGVEREQVRELWELAHSNNLVAVQDSRWVLGGMAGAWLEADVIKRWNYAVESWLKLLGQSSGKELGLELAPADSRTFAQLLADVYPLADVSPGSRGAKLAAHAELLGLTSKGAMQPWFIDVIEGSLESATGLVRQYFPAHQPRVILQADLSVVAPGPLDERVELELREFVEADSVGLASHFRISALSISYALERGHSVADIRDSLLRISGQVLPQPVDYLLNDVSKRFGRIKVVADESTGGCFIRVNEPTLAIELVNDLRHRIIALRQLEPELLFSKYSVDVVYFTLRDFGHLAVRATDKGEVIAPVKLSQRVGTTPKPDAIETMVERLRGSEQKAAEGDDESKLRQLQLAIKNKASVRVIYSGKDAVQYEFLLEPVGVANGRLRARDRKADIERTLPLANIVSLELA